MLDRLLQILDAKWLINREIVLTYLPVFLAFLNGQKLILEKSSGTRPHVIGFPNGQKKIFMTKAQDDINLTDTYGLDDPNLPENSVAVIPIDGVLMSWKTMDIVRMIHLASDNDKICSIIFMVNSPGGMVFYTDITAEMIKAVQKPTVSVIFNMAASAAMWLISATNYRIATSQMDRVGSIGVKTSFTDFNGFLKEKLGITVYDIYATLSTKKDEEIRALLAGNQQPILDDLDETNAIFHQAIMDNLGIQKDSEVFTGAIYNAKKGIELGLINEINSLEYAVNYAYQLGLANIIKSQFSFTH